MGAAGLLAVKSGFILFIEDYQFSLVQKLGDNVVDFVFKTFVSIITSLGYVGNKPC
jgi:hypothetical protein